jgi:hypothetical protein
VYTHYEGTDPVLEYMWMRMAHAAGAQRAMSLLAASFGLTDRGSNFLLPIVTMGNGGTRRAEYDAHLLDTHMNNTLDPTMPTLRGVMFIQLRCLDRANRRLANGLTVVGYAALTPADRPHVVAHVDHVLAILMEFQMRGELGGNVLQTLQLSIDPDWAWEVEAILGHERVQPTMPVDDWWQLPQATDTARDFSKGPRAWQIPDPGHLFLRLPAYARHDALPRLMAVLAPIMTRDTNLAHIRWGQVVDDPEWIHDMPDRMDSSSSDDDDAPTVAPARAHKRKRSVAGVPSADDEAMAEHADKKAKLKAIALARAAEAYVHAMLPAVPGMSRVAQLAALAAHADKHGRPDVAAHLACVLATHGRRRH